MAVLGPDVTVHSSAYVHDSAHLYGRVTLHEQASVWINAVARAEHQEIVIGAFSNIQDFVMLHVGDATPTIIGSHCSITHHCTIHGCTIGDNCLIGINSTIMDGCVIGDNCIIAGHTFLPEGSVIPANSIVMGTPGKVQRSQNNYVRNRLTAYLYCQNARAFAAQNYRGWSGPAFTEAVMAEMQKLQAEFAQLTK
jgi:carbonic anhydrase/acetyltransferase-like protein (isoleucine patch superfamily)